MAVVFNDAINMRNDKTIYHWKSKKAKADCIRERRRWVDILIWRYGRMWILKRKDYFQRETGRYLASHDLMDKYLRP